MRTLRLSLRNDLAEMATLASALQAFGAECGWSDDTIATMNLVLEELVTNVISYGYEDDAEHRIDITVDYDGAVATTRIVDDGRPFDPLARPAPDINAPLEERGIGGLGIHLTRELMTETHYSREGQYNVLTLRKADTN